MSRATGLGNSALVSASRARERRRPDVNLLVLAQTPPPLHGQSVMVRVMLDGLRTGPGFSLHHVNFRLSRDHADIGRWRLGKITATIGLAFRAIVARFRHGCDTLYYVPTPPGKRGALYRDWVVLALCRPFFRRLVLHWHACGLGSWLKHEATGIEILVTRLLLSRADLSIVLAESLRGDAEFLRARRIAVVPNGVPDPGPPAPWLAGLASCQALFLGLCSEEKGLFDAAAAIIAANERSGPPQEPPRFTLLAAGPFATDRDATRFRALTQTHPAMIRHAGFANETLKKILFTESRCLIFPTRYPAEGLPLAALEALAHDLPILATRWRGLPEVVTAGCGVLVEPGDVVALADALIALRQSPPLAGVCRARFLREFELSRHLDRLASALREIDPATTATAPAETRA